jgi:1-aminocyclopropane-1-carboxylate deaminase
MNELFDVVDAVIQRYAYFRKEDVLIDMKREDLLHPHVSGNKLRKLKYNLQAAKEQDHDVLLTYGGAFSNHIAATAAAGKICEFKTIGVIRGEELGNDLEKTLAQNDTLRFAQYKGMDFQFVSREGYRNKSSADFQVELRKRFGRFYNIPEGGTNELAVKGSEEILSLNDLKHYDAFAVAAGTGGTAAGIIRKAVGRRILIYSALKGDFLKEDISELVGTNNFEYYEDSVFGGYAKSNSDLIDFMNVRFRESEIPLEPIYTGKMMYRLEEQVRSGHFPRGTRILAVHTGGLQGIAGYNDFLRKKQRATLLYENKLP